MHGVVERTIPAVWALATACWVIGGVLLIGSELMGGLKGTAVHVGFICIAAAITLSVKGYFYRLWECEITAFRLGEQSEREKQHRNGMRSLR